MVFIGCVWPRKSLRKKCLVCKHKWKGIGRVWEIQFCKVEKSAVCRIWWEMELKRKKQTLSTCSSVQLSRWIKWFTKKTSLRTGYSLFKSYSLKVPKLREISMVARSRKIKHIWELCLGEIFEGGFWHIKLLGSKLIRSLLSFWGIFISK